MGSGLVIQTLHGCAINSRVSGIIRVSKLRLIEFSNQIDGVPDELTVGDFADNDDPILTFKFTRTAGRPALRNEQSQSLFSMLSDSPKLPDSMTAKSVKEAPRSIPIVGVISGSLIGFVTFKLILFRRR